MKHWQNLFIISLFSVFFTLCQSQQNQVPASNNAFNKQKTKSNIYTQIEQGIEYEKTAEYEKALELYETALKTLKSEPYLYERLGWTYYRLNQYKKAEFYFLQALSLNEKDSTAMAGLGRIYRVQKNYQKSIWYLDKAIQNNSKLDWAFQEAGFCYLDLTLQSVKKTDIDIQKPDYDLIQVKTALTYFTRSIMLNPTNFESYAGRGFAHFLLKNYNKAERDLIRTIKENPHFVWAYDKLKEVYLAQNFYKKARNILQSGIDANPDHFELYNNLAWIYLQEWEKQEYSIPIDENKEKNQNKDYDKALLLCEKALYLSEWKSPEIIDTYIRLLLHKDNVQKAEEIWKKSIITLPENQDIKNLLNLIESSKKNNTPDNLFPNESEEIKNNNDN